MISDVIVHICIKKPGGLLLQHPSRFLVFKEVFVLRICDLIAPVFQISRDVDIKFTGIEPRGDAEQLADDV